MTCWYEVSVVGKIITKNRHPQTLDLFAYPQIGNAKSERFISVTFQQNGTPLHFYLWIRHALNGMFHNSRDGASVRIT